jgi:putative transposase
VFLAAMAKQHGRRNLRLPGRDYGANGMYFVTIGTINGADLFGEVVRGQVRLNAMGGIVADNWRWLGSQHPHVTLDEWCVMPNHLHGILVLTTLVASPETLDAGPTAKPLGRLIGAFKTRSTNQVNRARQARGAVVWQRNFWERVIRDESELVRTRDYIRRNPAAYGPRTFSPMAMS